MAVLFLFCYYSLPPIGFQALETRTSIVQTKTRLASLVIHRAVARALGGYLNRAIRNASF